MSINTFVKLLVMCNLDRVVLSNDYAKINQISDYFGIGPGCECVDSGFGIRGNFLFSVIFNKCKL